MTDPEAPLDVKPKKPSTHAEKNAADLEKVTDYCEEIEISDGISAAVKAVTSESNDKAVTSAPKIKIKAEDIEFIHREFEVSKLVAEKKLREFHGDVKLALIALSR